jgi:hypothetical protein
MMRTSKDRQFGASQKLRNTGAHANSLQYKPQPRIAQRNIEAVRCASKAFAVYYSPCTNGVEWVFRVFRVAQLHRPLARQLKQWRLGKSIRRKAGPR